MFHLISVAINLSTRWQTRKKEGKSVGCKLVGVRGYGRDCTRRKQAKAPENCGFQGLLSVLILELFEISSVCRKSPNPTKKLKNSILLAVNRLFRQSERNPHFADSSFCYIRLVNTVSKHSF